MKKFLAFFLLVFIIVFSMFLLVGTTRADEISDLQKQIDELSKQLESSKNATTPLEAEVKNLESQ